MPEKPGNSFPNRLLLHPCWPSLTIKGAGTGINHCDFVAHYAKEGSDSINCVVDALSASNISLHTKNREKIIDILK